MPIIPSSFAPPPGLRGGHLQTILPVLWPRRTRVHFRTEELVLADGDFVELAWAEANRHRPRLAILSHGLEGGVEAQYIRGMADALLAAEWDVLAWAYRGCGASGPNRLARSYHSGETGDLGAVVARAAQAYGTIALVGFSLGGNVTLKYLGEAAPHPAVRAGVAISTPLDLAGCAARLDGGGWNAIYQRRFLATLVGKARAKAARFPEEVAATGWPAVKTIAEFDERFTAPLHGFRDAADYWARSSSRQFLDGIQVPTLIINARNDPLLSPGSFPFPEAKRNPQLFLEVPESGGHVGFLDFRRGREPWVERRVVGWLGKALSA